MKSKFNLKSLLIISVLLAVVCVVNVGYVQASEEEVDIYVTSVEEALDAIPDTYEADITEKEFADLWEAYMQADDDGLYEEVFLDPVVNALSETGFYVTGYNIVVYPAFADNMSMNIHDFVLEVQDHDYSTTIDTKNITFNYSNSDQYTEEDYVAVKKKADGISNMWVAYELEEEELPNATDICGKWVEKFIGDDSIEFKLIYNGMGGSLWSQYLGVYILFYKNDVCYLAKDCSLDLTYMITIPDEVSDTEEAYVNYAWPMFKEWYDKNYEGWPEATGLRCSDGQWYLVTIEEAEGIDFIILKKENTVRLYDGVTIASNENMDIYVEKLDEEEEVYAEMLDKVQDKGFDELFGAFEFTLYSGVIGEDGLTITFDVGEENNGRAAMILHKKHDGTYDEVIAVVENGRVSITVEELSPFIVALGERVLDDEPNTGSEGAMPYVLLSSIVSVAAIVIVKLKK